MISASNVATARKVFADLGITLDQPRSPPEEECCEPQAAAPPDEGYYEPPNEIPDSVPDETPSVVAETTAVRALRS